MPKRKDSSSRPSRSQKVPLAGTAKSIQHYNAVLIEDLRSEFKFVVEHVSDVERRLTEKIDDSNTEHRERFKTIEAILKLHTEMLHENGERWKRNEDRWNQNERRWEQNDKRWEQNDKRWEENDKRWEENERKLTRIEEKLDHVAEKVERHDHDIQEIKDHLF